MKKTAVITGGSSGIGKETALLLSQSGYKVYELSRKGTDSKGIIHIHADLTSEDSVRQAFLQIDEKKIDLLICNAGMGISGAVEYTDLSDARYLFDVNFFGGAACVSAARERLTGGRIIFISSVAGVLPIPFQAYYSASKAAVDALVLCLRNELRQFSISVCALLPGDVSTGFTSARKKSEAGDSVYNGRIHRSVTGMEHDEIHGMSPRKIAKRVLAISRKKNVKPFYSCGLSYQFFCLLSKILPASASNRLVGKFYS